MTLHNVEVPGILGCIKLRGIGDSLLDEASRLLYSAFVSRCAWLGECIWSPVPFATLDVDRTGAQRPALGPSKFFVILCASRLRSSR